MKSFKGHVNESIPLNEADTAECTGMEIVIVDAVNNLGKDGKGKESPTHKTIYKQLGKKIRLSGTKATQQANKKVKVSEFWNNITKKNVDEPKTDVIVGQEQISVKCGKAAQLCSGVATETEATFRAALEDKHIKVNADGEISNLLKSVEKMANRQVTMAEGEWTDKIVGDTTTLLSIMKSKVKGKEPMSSAEFQKRGLLKPKYQKDPEKIRGPKITDAISAFVSSYVDKEKHGGLTKPEIKKRAEQYAMWWILTKDGGSGTLADVVWTKPDDVPGLKYDGIHKAVDASVPPLPEDDDKKVEVAKVKKELRDQYDKYTKEKIQQLRDYLNKPDNNLKVADEANHVFKEQLRKSFTTDKSLAKAFAYEATTGYKKFGKNSIAYSPNLLYTSTDGNKFFYHKLQDSKDSYLTNLASAINVDVAFKSNSNVTTIAGTSYKDGFYGFNNTVRLSIDNLLLAEMDNQTQLESFDTMWNNLEYDFLAEGFIKDLMAKGKERLEAVKELWTRIWAGITNIWSKFVDRIKGIFKKALESVSAGLDKIKTFLSGSFDKVFDFCGIRPEIKVGAKIIGGNVVIDFARLR